MTEIEKAIHKSRKKDDEVPYRHYSDIGLGDEFAALVSSYDETLKAAALLEEEKRKLSKEIQSRLGERKVDRARVGDKRVLCYEGRTAHINRELLLEHGVSMDVIEESTRSTTYTVAKIIRD